MFWWWYNHLLKRPCDVDVDLAAICIACCTVVTWSLCDLFLYSSCLLRLEVWAVTEVADFPTSLLFTGNLMLGVCKQDRLVRLWFLMIMDECFHRVQQYYLCMEYLFNRILPGSTWLSPEWMQLSLFLALKIDKCRLAWSFECVEELDTLFISYNCFYCWKHTLAIIVVFPWVCSENGVPCVVEILRVQ